MIDEDRNRELLLKEASVTIGIMLRRLRNLRNSVLAKAESHFKSTVEFQTKDDLRATMYADEAAYLRNLAQKLYYGEILLEKVKVRLEVISLLGPVGEDLRVADQLMSEVKLVFKGVDVDLSEMDRISDQVSEIMESTKVQQAEQIPQVSEARSQEVSQILSEASTLAAERIAKEFPQVPSKEAIKVPTQEVEKEVVREEAPLEDRLFKYLNERSGQYSPDVASKDLGVSKEEIAKTLKILKDKGKIVLEDFEEEGGST